MEWIEAAWAWVGERVQWGTVREWAGLLGVVVPTLLWFFARRDRKAAEA